MTQTETTNQIRLQGSKSMSRATAALEYADQQAVAQQLIKKIGNALAGHQEKAQANPESWAHVGNIGHFNQLAREALEALGQFTA